MKLSEFVGIWCPLLSLTLQKEEHHGSAPVFLVVYGRVAGPVTLNALGEVLYGLLYVTIHIIWTPGFYLLEWDIWNLFPSL